jgi:hypothetical protein
LTVFVDDMFLYPLGQFRRMKMSHMISDSESELHAMADAIDVARKHFQGDHYDISISKRKEAIALGAVEITLRQCGLMRAVKGICGFYPEPESYSRVWNRRHDIARLI